MNPLHRLHADIDTRVHAILENRTDWLCGKGCDGCCRRLAELPRLTAAEWDLLQEGLAALPSERLRRISLDVSATAGLRSRPVVCPLLDHSTGTCPVYTHRPVACRTYGFYVQHKLGLYCGDIEARVAAGALADVVWGNHDAVDQRLAGLGDSHGLHEWFERWQSGR
jgi:Fe-S-cluster containining protein